MQNSAPAVSQGPQPATRWRDALLALEKPATDFDDPGLEWRRLFSELFGTFFLVLVGAGGAVVNATSQGMITRAAAVAAPGLMVMAIILFMGAVSGAHLNPAVTLAFAARRDFPWQRVPGYILIQLIGASLACLFLWAVFGKVGMLGATEPGPGVSDWQAAITELVLTVGLVSTILGTASKAQNVGALSAVAVGGYIILAGLWSSPISGASMNPARSFGPDLMLWNFSHYWVYLVGPIGGALIAVGFAWLLRGAGGDVGGLAAARGALDAMVQKEAQKEEVEGGTDGPD
jgi:aquaporin Z